MSIRKTSFAPGEFYHIYNRGNDKREIFHDNDDYLRFLSLINILNDNRFKRLRIISGDFLFTGKKQRLVSIGSYCLMPNHFHILITEKEEGGVSRFMQKAMTAYVMYYNQKYKRTGSLFEGKFKSEHAPDDRYLKYLFSYIHLNPVKLIQPNWKKVGIKNQKEVMSYLKDYKYSSYNTYLSGQDKYNIMDKDNFPDYFPSKESFEKEIFEWLNYGKENKFKSEDG